MSLGNLDSNSMHHEIQPSEGAQPVKTGSDKKLPESKRDSASQNVNEGALNALHLDHVAGEKANIHDCHEYTPSLPDKKEEDAFNQVALTGKEQAKSGTASETKGAFKKFLAARSGELVSFQKFKREVQMGSDAFSMKKLVQGLKAEKSEASFELPKLTDSQNPVAKVGGSLFLPKSALKTPKANVEDHEKALSSVNNQVRLLKNKGMEASLGEIMDPLVKYRNVDKSSPEALVLAREITNKCQIVKGMINKPPRNSPFKNEGSAIKYLDEIIKSMEPTLDLKSAENMTTFYNKDELLSQLNADLNFAKTDEDREKVENAIHLVKAENSSFITLSDDVQDALGAARTKLSNVNEYVSTAQFMKANSTDEAKATEVIKNAVKALGIQESTFAFKTGDENVREILAGKLSSTLELASYLAPKETHTIENATLSEQVNPQGIASRFLEESSSFSTAEWKAVLDAKMQLSLAEFHQSENPGDEGLQEKVLSQSSKLAESKVALREKEFQSTLPTSFKPFATLEKCTEALEKAKADLKKSPNDQKLSEIVLEKEQDLAMAKEKYDQNPEVNALRESFKGLSGVKEHVLTDLLFCAYDSHEGQYMIKNGSAFNIDFARFLAPSEVNERNGLLYPTLRTGLFSHPSSEEPLSASEIQKIQSWDLESIEREWESEGLIGDSAVFKEADKKINEWFDDLKLAKSVNSHKYIGDLCKKYDIEVGNLKGPALRKAVEDKINQQIEGQRAKCFSQVHPEAFAAFKSRVSALQAYITECQNENTPPTLKGAFPVMYPNMAPFMKVMERLHKNPGSGISFTVKNGGMVPRTLQSIIADAKEKNLASEEEIQEMEMAIENYQKVDARKIPLQTTMSLR